ncbi:unnamed protein product, partial [Prorocentrum cordatum]
ECIGHYQHLCDMDVNKREPSGNADAGRKTARTAAASAGAADGPPSKVPTFQTAGLAEQRQRTVAPDCAVAQPMEEKRVDSWDVIREEDVGFDVSTASAAPVAAV